jgi:hypothetical protein
MGLKVSFPENDIAVTTDGDVSSLSMVPRLQTKGRDELVGEARKFMVRLLPIAHVRWISGEKDLWITVIA